MRIFGMFALLAATTALGGCPADDGSALSLASSGTVCGVSSGQCATPTSGTTTTTTTTPTPVTTPAPAPNIGNTVTLTGGDGTIALEKSVLVSPKTDPAYSKLTLGTLPNTAKFEIDSKSPNNALWPVAKTMDEYTPGTIASGSAGLGGTYKEYRALTTSSAGAAVDEELQVWKWQYSYGTQYRDVSSGGEATHQAWSFGGTKTASAAMPVAGSATYNGQFGATAKTSNWINSGGATQTVDNNGIWRVIGTTQLTANFATAQFSGILTPTVWNKFASMNGGSGFTNVVASNILDPNHAVFMDSQVVLNGTIATNATTGNSVNGNAVLDPSKGWITNQTLNPMYAGFFGPTANEVSGVFNFESVIPGPIGGVLPINDDRRAYIQMSGVFNGQ
jgi:C-lobe and N-lobe beta barrels of Tf-binding protein B